MGKGLRFLRIGEAPGCDNVNGLHPGTDRFGGIVQDL